MPVCRMILRLDFSLAPEIVNSPGKVIDFIWKTLESNDREGVAIKENINQRMISGIQKTTSRSLGINVGPTTINSSIEILNGVEYDNLYEDDSFSMIIKLVDELCQQFTIDRIERFGFRVFYFKKFEAEFESLLSTFDSMHDNSLMTKINSSLGKIEDYGISLDGSAEDNIKFHLRVGPHKPNEADKYFTEIANAFKESTDYNFICDLDLYELKFNLTQRSLIDICSPYVDRGKACIYKLVELINTKLENV